VPFTALFILDLAVFLENFVGNFGSSRTALAIVSVILALFIL
jgi:hypothetical protein